MLEREITIDAFAGGGGASTGIELGFAVLGLAPTVDIAVNHDEDALAMHRANHPATLHVREDVFECNMREMVGARLVRLLWMSPDCKHFSKAKGGKPVEKRIRGLAWVGVKWAQQLKPRVIILENVEEFQDWGPLKRIDGKWYPDPDRKGETFQRFIGRLRRLGYKLEWRQLRACDYGAPTIRKRLFVIGRLDGQPITWPKATHGKGSGKAYRTAADCIDWSIPCRSIFGRKKPLADATLRRIAHGIQRYVIDAAEPFIVTNTSGHPGASVSEPLRTVTTGGHHALVMPHLEHITHGGRLHSAEKPLPTVTSAHRGELQLVTAFLAQHNTMPRGGVHAGHHVRTPVSTVSSSGAQQQLVTSHLLKLRGTCLDGQPVDEPMPTITGGGWHVGEVRAFLIKYYGEGGQWQAVNEPLHTIPTKDRIGLVLIHGELYKIVDIRMRMLTPRELARAQGFPDSYVIDRGADGAPLTKTAQVRMIGNSVCPPVAQALIEANFAGEARQQRRAA